jgi:hypothetical protein
LVLTMYVAHVDTMVRTSQMARVIIMELA